MWFSQAGPGNLIQSRLESSGTTSPTNTVDMSVAEKGFASFRIADGATAAKNTVGATKAIAMVAAATAGFVGRDVLQPHGTNAPIVGVVGLLETPTGYVASGVAGVAEFGYLQVYGYFDDALLDTSVAAAADLVGEAETNDLITATIETPDSGTGTVNCYGSSQKTVAVAMEADTAGVGDVFLMCI